MDLEFPKSACKIFEENFCKGHCAQCNPSEIAENIAKDPLLFVKEKEATECLYFLGYTEAADQFSSPSKSLSYEPEFICATLGTNLVDNCRLKECSFWAPYDQGYNCVLAYMHQREAEELTPNELSFLLKKPVTEIKSILNGAIKKLRQASLGSPVCDSLGLPKDFEFLKTTEVCCVCNDPTPKPLEDGLTIEPLGLAYCSKDCKTYKGPQLIQLEHRYHAAIEDILEWSLSNFQSIHALEQALGLSRALIDEAIDDFLEDTKKELLPGLKGAEPVKVLMRRTGSLPLWIKNIEGKLDTVKDYFTHAYGKSTIDISFIKKEVIETITGL